MQARCAALGAEVAKLTADLQSARDEREAVLAQSTQVLDKYEAQVTQLKASLAVAEAQRVELQESYDDSSTALRLAYLAALATPVRCPTVWIACEGCGRRR